MHACVQELPQAESRTQIPDYALVLDGNNNANIAEGVSIALPRVYCAAQLKNLGLMKGDLDEAVAQGAHAMFFQCGLGHMLGLDVHDMADFGEIWVGYEGQRKSTLFGIKSLRLARTLQPGFVFTIEPGIYFIPKLISRW
jgi:Xaa-Pro aminopeptidase